MTQRIKNYIKQTTFLDPQEIDAATNGDTIDTHIEAQRTFDTIVLMASTGEFGTDIGSVKFKVEESDSSDMSSATVATGGTETSVDEESTEVFEVQRSKRYIRVVATPVAVGSPSGTPGEDAVVVSVNGLLTNWAKDIPLL
jgi:hypothetical protein